LKTSVLALCLLSILPLTAGAGKHPCICSERDQLKHSDDDGDPGSGFERDEFPLLNETIRLFSVRDDASDVDARDSIETVELLEGMERRRDQQMLVCDYGPQEDIYRFWFQSPPREIHQLQEQYSIVLVAGFDSALLACPATNRDALQVQMHNVTKLMLLLFDDFNKAHPDVFRSGAVSAAVN